MKEIIFRQNGKKEKRILFLDKLCRLNDITIFVMLVLFVLTIALLHKKMVATQAQLDKIEEIEKATNSIDSTYFEYNKEFKKHKLKVDVRFSKGSSNINELSQETKDSLVEAGKDLVKTLSDLNSKYPEIKYLLIIEGQASKDSYTRNYELSYARALALNRFWKRNNINFGDNCEVLISGSGTGGEMRDTLIESNNQRFLITLVPKPGIIEQKK